MSKGISRSKLNQVKGGSKATSPYTTPQALFLLGLNLLTPEQRNQYWRYLALTDYGTQYIPPEKQLHLLKHLTQLEKQEKLDELDVVTRLKRLKEMKEHILQEGEPQLALA